VRTPGLTLALLLTIALGIGSNVCVHGFVRGLTRPSFPLTSVDKVVSVFGRDAHRDAGPLSYQDYLSLKSHHDVFEWLGAARVSPGAIGLAGQSAIVSVAAVTSNLAGLLNLSLDSGVVISDRIRQSEFGAKAEVRGEQIRIDGVETRVSGVAPKWLEGIYRDHAVDLWMPLQETDRSSRNFWILGRLRRGVSIARAQTAILSSEMGVLPYTGMTPEMADGMSRVSYSFSHSHHADDFDREAGRILNGSANRGPVEQFLSRLFIHDCDSTGLIREAEHAPGRGRQSEEIERAGGELTNIERDLAKRQRLRFDAEGLPRWLAPG
jgi:hypothetical protein